MGVGFDTVASFMAQLLVFPDIAVPVTISCVCPSVELVSTFFPISLLVYPTA